MDRCGTKTPEELIDKALATGDQIISTTCECCGKVFYILKSDLYAENVFANKDEEFKVEHNTGKVLYPKCPYCGFACKIEKQVQKPCENEKWVDPFDREYMPWKDVNLLDWSKYK